MAPAALLTFVFVLGFLLGYLVREIISQRRQWRALMQLSQHEVRDLQPARRVVEEAGTSSSSPPLAPDAGKAARSSKQASSDAG
jgi:hypothetical protein